MLLNKQNTVGVVDFGSRAIRVLIARQDDDGPIQILGHGSAPGVGCVSQGVVQDRNAARIALKQALSDAQKEARVKVTSLVCGVNGKNVETFIREGQVKLPQDARKTLADCIWLCGEIVRNSRPGEGIAAPAGDAQKGLERLTRLIDPKGWVVSPHAAAAATEDEKSE